MVGQTISHYSIEAELGQGGMGVVYTARDTKLERTVALKFLPPMFSRDEAAKARFIHEARAVSALDHPNVAVVHEIGETDKGEMFIAMAYYEGRTLEEVIAEGEVSLDDAVSYALDMARGLAAAHDKGIVHRDIKPGNVMVTNSGFLKILDFGLAKVQDVNMTMVATSVGTLAYMSPEQARGGAVDQRTDLWALGVVIYEMLAGKRPFEGPYDAAILYAAANTDHESVSSWRADAPEHLAAIVDKLLQKQPEDRYQDAHELIADIEALRAPTNSVISSITRGMEDHLSGFAPVPEVPLWKRPGVILGGIALVVVAVAGSMYVSSLGRSDANEITDLDREQARTFLASGRKQTNSSLALADFERALEYDSTYVAAWISLSGVKNQLRDPEGAASDARHAIRLDSTSSMAFYNLGVALANKDSIQVAIDALSRAVALDGKFIPAYSAWGDILIEDGQVEKALEVLHTGLQSADATYRFLIEKNLGKAYIAREDYASALNYLEASELNRPDWPETVLLLARTYDALGDPSRARTKWERYLEIGPDLDARKEANLRLGQ